MKDTAMNDTARVLGKLEEFKSWSKTEFMSIRNEFSSIRKELKILNQFRWTLYGGSAVVSMIVVVLFEIVSKLLKGG